VLRWRTQSIAEYEVDYGRWSLQDAQTKFLPYSRQVYLPQTQEIVTLGGLADEFTKPYFSNAVTLISQIGFTEHENIYIPRQLPPMTIGRGCFAACF